MNIVAGALAGVGPGAGWRLGADEAAANHCVAHTLRADGFDASEDGTGRGTPLVPVGVDYTNGLIQGDISGTLEAAQSKGNRGQGVIQPMAFGWQNAAAQGMPVDTIAPTLDKSKHPAVMGADTYNGRITGDLAATLGTQSGDGVSSGPSVLSGASVRRLMPVECERLQGFPDCYTAIPWRGKPASECPDRPRYKALGNSWAVNCARWIGRRIASVDGLSSREAA